MTGEDIVQARTSTYPPFRSDRFYTENGQWYFAIRRGPDQGPYASREDAEAALEIFLAEQLGKERRRRAERHLGRHPALATR